MDSSCADKSESEMGNGKVEEDNLTIFQYFCRNKNFLQKNSLLKTVFMNFEIITFLFSLHNIIILSLSKDYGVEKRKERKKDILFFCSYHSNMAESSSAEPITLVSEGRGLVSPVNAKFVPSKRVIF